MKASEVIAALQAAIAEHGDLVVVSHDSDYVHLLVTDVSKAVFDHRRSCDELPAGTEVLVL